MSEVELEAYILRLTVYEELITRPVRRSGGCRENYDEQVYADLFRKEEE